MHIHIPPIVALIFIAGVLQAPPIPSLAQTADQPPVSEAGACPAQATLERLNPGLSNRSSMAVQMRSGSLTRSNLPLYRYAALDDREVQTTPSEYDDKVEVLLGAYPGLDGPALV